MTQPKACLRLHCEEARDSENFLIVSEVRIPLPTLVGDHLPINLAVIVRAVVCAPSKARLLKRMSFGLKGSGHSFYG